MNRSASVVYRIGGLLARALDRLLLTAPPPEWEPEASPPGSGRRAPPAHGRRRRARSLVWAFLVGVLLLHVAMVCAMDVVWPELRDPEYGRRVNKLRARVAEHPNRPLVLVVGTSRAAQGVQPSAWEETRPGSPDDPLVFNMSAVGCGPVLQLMLLRRAFADGFRPAVVLLEYWPTFFHQDLPLGDVSRYDPHRYRWDDRAVLRDYYPDPAGADRWMLVSRLNVFTENRAGLLAQIDTDLRPRGKRVDVGWADIDDWGWLPGMELSPDDTETRRKLTEGIRKHVGSHFPGRPIHPDSDRALREAVALARAHGARVGFVYLPESPEFQSRYAPELERIAREYLGTLSRDLAVPVINARDWMDERYLADGFHLSRAGAAVFTAKFGPAVAATFPPAGGKP